jgi:hypothetical protein
MKRRKKRNTSEPRVREEVLLLPAGGEGEERSCKNV